MTSYPPLSTLLPAAINHLLVQEPWARDKLAAHAGKIACMDAGVIAIRLQVASDGLLEQAITDGDADVTIRVKLSDLPLLMQNRERAFSTVKVEGDAELASTISQLGQSLRWEAEEDLSRWVGDIAATRLVAGARAALDAAQSTQRKLAENVAEYFLEENPMLVRPQAVADFTSEVTRLRDDVERMAKRIDKLKGNAK